MYFVRVGFIVRVNYFRNSFTDVTKIARTLRIIICN